MGKKWLSWVLVGSWLLGFWGCSGETKDLEKYDLKLQMASVLITKSTHACLNACRANLARWQQALVTDEGFERITSANKGLHFNQNEVEKILTELENPEPERVRHQMKLLRIYKIYKQALSMTRKVRGTVQTYSKEINRVQTTVNEAKQDFDDFVLTGTEDGNNLEEETEDESYADQADVLNPKKARVEELIRQLQQETNLYKRREAAHALGRLGDQSAVDPLIDALEDKSWQVHLAAAWALKKLTGENYQWTYEEWKERHRQE